MSRAMQPAHVARVAARPSGRGVDSPAVCGSNGLRSAADTKAPTPGPHGRSAWSSPIDHERRMDAGSAMIEASGARP